MSKKNLSLIVATTFDGGIGYDNKIPWYIKEDLKKFKNITTECDVDKKNAIIMGRKTYESLPKNKLPNRINIIITNNKEYNKFNSESDIIIYNDIKEAIKYCNENNKIDKIFIIGGATIYDYYLNNHIHNIDKIYLSVLCFNKDIKCNIFIDIEKIYKNFLLIKDEKYNSSEYKSYICYLKSNIKL
tara:strand:+ start:11724 stop:12281 length:558 start_codon:yes stop_codon:yes gene_type:complete